MLAPNATKSMSLIKSKKRVVDHGEVFTPPWMVEAMLDLVKDETQRIDSRFLEPACGSGNFMVPILRRKLAAVEIKYGKAEFERKHFALYALMSIYGIELLIDNVQECHANMLETLSEYLGIASDNELYRAAEYVLDANVIHGDALSMKTHFGLPITFAEWGYLGKGKFKRRDFQLEALTGASAFNAENSLFAQVGRHDIFVPSKVYPPMTVRTMAGGTTDGTEVL
jgi:hypothetical protein